MPEYVGKMYAKMRHLIQLCHSFAYKHDGQFPEKLADLEKIGVKSAALKILLAAPDRPNGPPVIQYRRPRDGKDWGTEIMFYPKYDQWPKPGLPVGVTDGHGAVIPTEKQFKKMME